VSDNLSGSTGDTKQISQQNIISVSFPHILRLSYYLAGDVVLKVGDYCLVQTEYGIGMGQVHSTRIPEKFLKFFPVINTVQRKATEEDIEQHQRNLELEQQAYALCVKKIKERNLPMKLVRVKFFFDRSKSIFYFTADGRVDFRELVKDLAYEFKTRIEMRQIGVRDEAKMIGGYGCCGLSLCCCTFLKDFEPVSIRMAKEQNLTLIPAKISGLCGRLMCCLMYEFETYREIKKQFPKVGRKVLTTAGEGKVARINVVRESFLVDLPDKGLVELKKKDILKSLPNNQGNHAEDDENEGDAAG